MPICPAGLDGIAADCLPADKIEAAPDEVLTRLHDSSGDIRFAFAGGTWALPPEGLEREIRFQAIAPSQRQFVADFLDGREINGIVQMAKSLYSGLASSVGGWSIPAPTVAFVPCSIRINDPVSRLVP